MHVFATAQGDLIFERRTHLLTYRAASTQVSDAIEKQAVTLRSFAGSSRFRSMLLALLLKQNIVVSLNP